MQKNANQTRLRILNAARNLFSSHGFSGTSLDDILTAAGITKGAFYHHFKTKEHVCECLLDEAVGSVQHQAGRLDIETDPYEQIRLWVQNLIRPGEQGLYPHCRLALRLTGDLSLFSTPTPDKINRFWKEQHIALAALLRQVPFLHPSCRGPEESASILLTVFTGALWMQQSSMSAADIESLMETCMQMVLTPAPPAP